MLLEASWSFFWLIDDDRHIDGSASTRCKEGALHKAKYTRIWLRPEALLGRLLGTSRFLLETSMRLLSQACPHSKVQFGSLGPILGALVAHWGLREASMWHLSLA